MHTRQFGDRWIVLIAVFKLVKGVLLFSVRVSKLPAALCQNSVRYPSGRESSKILFIDC